MHICKYIILLTIIGLLLYSPIVPGKFVLDDKQQITSNKLIHNRQNILSLMTKGIAGPKGNNNYFTFYYRPLPFMIYSLIYSISKKSMVYHLVQILVTIFNVILIFLIFRVFFTPKLSFILSLIFLVHVITQSLTGFIANYFDLLSLNFGLIALLVLKTNWKSWYKALISNIFLLLALFSKESAFLFIPIIAFFNHLYSKIKLKSYGISFLIILAIYFFLRSSAFQHPFLTYHSYNPIILPLAERLIMIPNLLFYIIKELTFPALTVPTPSDIISNPLNKLLIISMFTFVLILLVILSKYLYIRSKKNFKTFLMFLSIFCLGTIFYLQIIPLDAFFARRWLSLPLLGLLGIYGTLITGFPIKSKKLYTVFVIFLAIYILTMTMATLRLNILIGSQ